MKRIVILIFIFTGSASLFCQNNTNTKSGFVLIDQCSNKVITPAIKMHSIPNSNNKVLTYYVMRGDYFSQNSITVKTSNRLDTLFIPRILFSSGSELHSKRWLYLNCEKICNGIETDYYENGRKRIEGDFVNGKPKEIKNYRKNGTLEYQELYNLGTLDYKRVNYFDESGELLEYEIYKKKKKKTIINVFDKAGELTERNIQKHYIIK